jgi:RecA-family ATPase
MRDPFTDIAEDWDKTEKPWLADPLYGGMSPESAQRSWEAAKSRPKRMQLVPNGTIADLEEDNQDNQQFKWLDMSKWDSEPVPERKWAIRDRVPLNQAGLFSGEGGTGKSIIELTKNCAHVLGKDWLGSLPEPGPAFYIGAEDEADEIRRRLSAIAPHYGTTFAELIAGGLYIRSMLGEDATLCVVGKNGKVETTPFYRQLYEAAGDIRPKNISIDTLSRAFAGNEIDRVQVYAFAMHMQALAMVAGSSVTVLSHPSLVIWNPSSPHYRRALGASKGERLWRMQVGGAGRSLRWC